MGKRNADEGKRQDADEEHISTLSLARRATAPSMDPHTGPPPGLSRPKTSPPPPPHTNFPNPNPPLSAHPIVASLMPQRAATASWASSLAAGLFPATFPSFPVPPQVPHGLLPSNAAAQPAGCLHNNGQITDLGTGLPAPAPSDPWHRAHTRVCAHAIIPCAACSVVLFCCTCRALRFTPGPPPVSPSVPANTPRSPAHIQRYRSASPTLFRSNVGNGTPPPGFDSHNDDYDDDAYAQALADADTCDNSSCPRGDDEPATYTITVEQFDEGTEESYDRTFRACSACNRSCRKSFLGHKIKSRRFDNSIRESSKASNTPASSASSRRTGPIPGSASYAREHPVNAMTAVEEPRLSSASTPAPLYAREHPADAPASPKPLLRCADSLVKNSDSGAAQAIVNISDTVPAATPALNDITHPGDDINPTATAIILQDALRILNTRPPTPAAFVATMRVKHDALCTHPVSSCPICSCGLLCCSCKRLFTPAVARHLACAQCKHVAYSCCQSTSCCECGKLWLPSDAVIPPTAPLAQRFRGGAGTGTLSSPEPDIWTPSPRSSPDEIDDLTARANLPLPASRSESDASRAPSRASSIDVPVNVAATPIPTPDYSSLSDDLIDGLTHPSFPDRAILDTNDKRHFLGRGDLSVTSLKLYARRIFTETSHWITAGHFLVDIFQGATIRGSRDDFRRFVILVGTQLGYGDLAQSMSESLDVNRKMADEYMRLRDVATTWKQKAKDNAKSAKDGRKARDELLKTREDIAAILEEREIFIQQRREFLAKDDQLTTELNRVHKDYGNAIEDNAKFAANIETLEQNMALLQNELDDTKNRLSMAEHHRDKAEQDCNNAVLRFDKEVADHKRDKAFYEARILALSGSAIPTSQPDSETPLSAAAIDKATLMTRLENLKKELAVRDTELAKLRSEVSPSPEVNTLCTELAEAKAVAARLSDMYEQKSKDFRDSKLERLALLGKQILADGAAPAPPAHPHPVSRRGRQRSRSSGRVETAAITSAAPMPAEPTPPSSQPFWQDEPLFTKHVAAVTTATMSALPHLPFETAIATAFSTVRSVGPPPHSNWIRNQVIADRPRHHRPPPPQFLSLSHMETSHSQTSRRLLLPILMAQRKNPHGMPWKRVKLSSSDHLQRAREFLNCT